MNPDGKNAKEQSGISVSRIPALTTLYEGIELNPFFENTLSDIMLVIQGHRMGQMVTKDFEQAGIDTNDWEEVRSAVEGCITY
jgi:hypothetical protein